MNFVIAVSGGVDSMVLLGALANGNLAELCVGDDFQLTTNDQLIIAHFDHGIRSDSPNDEAFVRGVAESRGLIYESERAELGIDASEERARTARYNFLRRCCKKYNAYLVTAHHQDDVIETMIINLVRGTGWRGLAPMSQTSNICSNISDKRLNANKNQESKIKNHVLRPLINTPKESIVKYAQNYSIQWREDSTNKDTKYLRNYIRLTLIPELKQKDTNFLQKILLINKNVTELKNKIATESQNLIIKYQKSNIKYAVPRYDFIMLPSSVSLEVIYSILTDLKPDWHPTKKHLKNVLHFVKTGKPSKRMEVAAGLSIELTKREAQFKKV